MDKHTITTLLKQIPAEFQHNDAVTRAIQVAIKRITKLQSEEDQKQFIAGAETMRTAVFFSLSPLLQSLDYGGHSIASIFKDVDLLYEVTADNIEQLKNKATIDFFQKEQARLNEQTNQRSVS